jgi:TRAP-type C4-dicarboxylate transport system substrate-binding protein
MRHQPVLPALPGPRLSGAGRAHPGRGRQAAVRDMLGQKYLTLWGYTADPLVFAVSREVWESWTPADREAVHAAALQAAAENVRAARRGIADGSAVKTIEAQGVTVTRLTPEEKQAFAAATRAAYDKWTDRIGRDLLDQARAAIAAH